MREVPLRMEVAFLYVYVLLVKFCLLHGRIFGFGDVLKLAVISRVINHGFAIEH